MPSRQPKPGYHHGNLRQELLDASLRLIAEEGVGAVSLRRVAREAGVSPGAPYHHFADRAALLAALATEGFETLAARLAAARDAQPDPRSALLAMLEAYVAFAVTDRAHFLLMFRPELSDPDKHLDVQTAGDAAFRTITEPLADWSGAGAIPDGDTTGMVVTLWTLGHGIAALWIDGHLEKRCAELDSTPEQMMELIKATVGRLLDGWIGPKPP